VSIRSTPDAIGDLLAGISMTLSSAAGPLTATGTLDRHAGSASRGSDYAVLSRLVKSAGLLRRRPGAYAVQFTVTLALFGATCAAVAWVGDSWYQMGVAVALGVAFTQVAFLGHDVGHQQVFARRRANDLLGRVMGDLLVGLSYGWWVDKHNRHHATRKPRTAIPTSATASSPSPPVRSCPRRVGSVGPSPVTKPGCSFRC